MVRRVFFSFHHQDVVDFRANVVRNHWLLKPAREDAGFFDASIWESARRSGSVALKRLINGGLDGTSNTCVLIGTETFARPWVRYELLKSFRRANHIFGVHINGIRSRMGTVKPQGPNPLQFVGVTYSYDGSTATLWERNGTAWRRYEEIDGSATYRVRVEPQYRGKGFHLANWYRTYDWVKDDGFNRFADWVK